MYLSCTIVFLIPHKLRDHNYDSHWVGCSVDQMGSDSWKLGRSDERREGWHGDTYKSLAERLRWNSPQSTKGLPTCNPERSTERDRHCGITLQVLVSAALL